MRRYLDTNLDCLPSCKDCILNSSNCIECSSFYYRNSNNQCIYCSPGTFLNISTNSCIDTNLVDLIYFEDFSIKNTPVIYSIKGFSIEFWAYLNTNQNNSTFTGYMIDLSDGLLKIEILAFTNKFIKKATYIAPSSRKYSINDSFEGNRWNYIIISLNFVQFIRLNSVNSTFFTENIPNNFNNSIILGNKKIDYYDYNSLYLKNFRIWKIAVDSAFDTSQ